MVAIVNVFHEFFSPFVKSKNAGIQMAMSKVHKPQTFLGIGSRSTVPLIQIVLIDNGTGTQIGTRAEQLAKDIMSDVAEHGNSFFSPDVVAADPHLWPHIKK